MSFEAVHHTVARVADQHGDRIAVQSPDGDLSYADLATAAGRVTADLVDAGVGQGDLIPILADDRREVTAAILGVLDAGAVFVPLDPAGPPGRLVQILADLTPRHVVLGTGGPALALLPSATTTSVVELAGPAAPQHRHRWQPDDPCYIFYTSGSTGAPKGIVGRIGGIDHFIRWETELVTADLQAAGDLRVSQLTSPAFDAVLRDLLLPLTNGGTVCVPTPGLAGDPNGLLRWLADARVTVLHCVPSVFRGLVDAAEAADVPLPDLSAVLTAGEPLTTDPVRRWRARYGAAVTIVNLYGPSETTMTKLFHVVGADDLDGRSIPIGRPMPGAEVLLLDERRRPCPPGAVGEIYLWTPYRSLGYHRRPELTAAVFVPNPLTGDTDDVVYRTGDLCRQRADGVLEYLGRQDHQVKIAGVRVEFGEVEAVLRTVEGVTDAAVIAAAGSDDQPYLCAYLILSAPVDDDDVRRHLREQLPEEMVPAVFVRLDHLPRTISGKVDRSALPVPRPHPLDPAEDGPRTPTEEALTTLWLRVLPVPQVGVRQRFFDAGGHSLDVMRMLLQVQREFGVEVPLREFLSQPTIAGLAEHLEAAVSTSASLLDGSDLVAQVLREEGWR
jgi:amino acid adenylation domain-containing protein